MTRDLRTLIYLLNLELREECSSENIGLESSAAGAASGCGEQQSKRTQSGSSSRSGRDREQLAAEADASGERAAAAEAGAIGERSWKRTQTGSSS